MSNAVFQGGAEVKRTLLTLIAALSIVVSCVPAMAAGGESSGMDAAIALYREGRLDEADAAFDKLREAKPSDDRLRICQTLVRLEKARTMRESGNDAYKGFVVNSYAVLKPMWGRNADNPDWYFAMAKALWLNDRSQKAKKSVEKAFFYRRDYPEGHLLLGDIALEEGRNIPAVSTGSSLSSPGFNARSDSAREARRAYDAVLASKAAVSCLRAEAHYKLGLTALELEGARQAAVACWQEAAKTDPGSRYGKMAAERLSKETAR